MNVVGCHRTVKDQGCTVARLKLPYATLYWAGTYLLRHPTPSTTYPVPHSSTSPHHTPNQHEPIQPTTTNPSIPPSQIQSPTPFHTQSRHPNNKASNSYLTEHISQSPNYTYASMELNSVIFWATTSLFILICIRRLDYYVAHQHSAHVKYYHLEPIE